MWILVKGPRNHCLYHCEMKCDMRRENQLSSGEMHITALKGKWSWSPDSRKFPQTLLSRLHTRIGKIGGMTIKFEVA